MCAVWFCKQGNDQFKLVHGVGVSVCAGQAWLSREASPLALYRKWSPGAAPLGLQYRFAQAPNFQVDHWFHTGRHTIPVPLRADGSLSIDARGNFVNGVAVAREEIESLQFPLWFPIALTLIYPLWTLRRFRSQKASKRFAAGLCIHCGYDLRASPNRCPECGRVPSPPPPVNRVVDWLANVTVRRVVVCSVLVVGVVGSTLIMRSLALAYGIHSMDFLTQWR
jgi:hypothetical protein